MESKNIAVIGAGSWGTAIAILLSSKGYNVRLWDVDSKRAEKLIADRENKQYLPNIKFPNTLHPIIEIEEVLAGAELAIFAAPAQQFRVALDNALPYIENDTKIVNLAKGIEQHTLLRMSEIAYQKVPQENYAVLSGPSHAEEVGLQKPTTVVVASTSKETAEYVQDVFFAENFRVYTSQDVIGVELGGALKNIIALGAGISDGMEFGDNAKAALMTRGIAEISRLGVAMGADIHTFSGLSGVGDLIVTCTSMHSRNRRCGLAIGEGKGVKEAVDSVGMVVEGMYTAEAAYELAKKYDVEMPIVEGIYEIISKNASPKEIVKQLMLRDKKMEKTH
ncbi:MAG: NAD(P)H-dependent glycerol-3-phosphate dehydrogenase [Clostridiales bacterium]|nr:NAD(P)H-dependent glycerol-3-phosphate dehydrogenase [Clostridiales bacterium]